jgi:hypothetical protein
MPIRVPARAVLKRALMKTNPRALVFLLLAGASVACGAPTSTPGDESVAQSAAAISTYQWTAEAAIPGETSYERPALYALNATFFLVHGGGSNGAHDLWWTKGTASGFPNGDQPMGMSSWYPATLAGFPSTTENVYVAHVGTDTGDTDVWFARYNWQTGSWNHDFQLPFYSKGTPAIAVYDNLLYMVGTDPDTLQLWQATMTPDETFSAPVPIPGLYAAVPPSLAVFEGKLYMAHLGTSTTGASGLMWSSFNGTSWSSDQAIPGQASYHTPAIAAYGSHIHMVHSSTSASDPTLWWSYFDGTSWSPEVSLPGQYASGYQAGPLGLSADGAGGLVLAHSAQSYLDFTMYWSRFNDVVFVGPPVVKVH